MSKLFLSRIWISIQIAQLDFELTEKINSHFNFSDVKINVRRDANMYRIMELALESQGLSLHLKAMILTKITIGTNQAVTIWGNQENKIIDHPLLLDTNLNSNLLKTLNIENSLNQRDNGEEELNMHQENRKLISQLRSSIPSTEVDFSRDISAQAHILKLEESLMKKLGFK